MGKVRQNKNWLMRIFTTHFVFKNDFSVKLHSYKLNLSLNVSIVPPPLCIFNSRLSLITLKASPRSWWRRYVSQVRAVASVPGIFVSMAGLVGALGGWIWPIRLLYWEHPVQILGDVTQLRGDVIPLSAWENFSGINALQVNKSVPELFKAL